jgi:hypothetical protein
VIGVKGSNGACMRSRKKFTPEVISEIRRWVDQGLSAAEIAQKVGCTLGTLRVRCSQLGIRLRRAGMQPVAPSSVDSSRRTRGVRPRSPEAVSRPHLRLVISVPRKTLNQLRTRAVSKGFSGPRFAAALLERIAEDDLYEAVLDER